MIFIYYLCKLFKIKKLLYGANQYRLCFAVSRCLGVRCKETVVIKFYIMLFVD